ncbi:MAG: hypothetical protein HY534_07775 [Chloroflexi bacterium]|nr:hypothetical protein [Chloroflexota bacterium]
MAGIALPYPRLRGRVATRSMPRFAPPSERLVLSIGGALIFITAVLNFYVFQLSVVATSAYQVQDLQREQDIWAARNAQLQLELAKARSLRWVEYKSVTHLGMVGGEEPIYLKVDLADGPDWPRSVPAPPAPSRSVATDARLRGPFIWFPGNDE